MNEFFNHHQRLMLDLSELIVALLAVTFVFGYIWIVSKAIDWYNKRGIK
jgi:hypothetical protein